MSGRTLGILGVVVVLLGFVALSALFVVRQTEQAIVLQFGAPKAVYREPGLHVKLPFLQETIYFEKRVLNLDPPAEKVLLSDQKPLIVDTYLRYRITDPLKFFQSAKTEANLRALLSRLNTAALRQVLGDVTLSMVLSEDRQRIMIDIRDSVNRKARRFGIDVMDVRLRRADLPDATSQAVYARMRTERQREAAEFRAQGYERAQEVKATADRESTVIRAEAERDAQILRGKGDGERTRILGAAYGTDQEFFDFYRSMQAYREGLRVDDTTFVLTPDSEFFRFFRELPDRGG